MPTLKPNTKFSKLAIIALWIILLLNIASLLWGFIFLFTEKMPPRHFLKGLVSYAQLFSAITFLLWFFRAYSNLHKLVGDLKYKSGWAIGSWFVPVLNFFRPYRMMKELYQRTGEVLNANGIPETKLKTSPLGLWWTFWLLPIILSLILGVYVQITTLPLLMQAAREQKENINAETVQKILESAYLPLSLSSIIMGVVFIFDAYLAIKIIKNYSKIEPLLANCKDLKTLREERTAIFSSVASEPPPLN
jgi:ABC-type multidrug transport system fused ATPase/permease subunit